MICEGFSSLYCGINKKKREKYNSDINMISTHLHVHYSKKLKEHCFLNINDLSEVQRVL